MRDRKFYPIEEFPCLEELVRHWKTIRREFLSLEAPVLEIDRAGKTHEDVIAEINEHMQLGGQFGWLLGWGENGANRDWVQYALVVNGAPVPFLRGRMAETIRLLSGVPGIKVCALSKMKPHSFLSTHRHPELVEENLLQCHITIDAPFTANYCYLNVSGEFRQHQNGGGLVFDGSLDHFAVNATAADRTILYMEFDRSLCSATEQAKI